LRGSPTTVTVLLAELTPSPKGFPRHYPKACRRRPGAAHPQAPTQTTRSESRSRVAARAPEHAPAAPRPSQVGSDQPWQHSAISARQEVERRCRGVSRCQTSKSRRSRAQKRWRRSSSVSEGWSPARPLTTGPRRRCRSRDIDWGSVVSIPLWLVIAWWR